MPQSRRRCAIEESLKPGGMATVPGGGAAHLSGLPGGVQQAKKSPYLRTSSSLNMAVRRGLTRFARPAGSLFAMLSVCPTGCAATRPIPGPRPYGASAGAVQNCSWQFCVEPRSGLLIPAMLCNIRKKSPYLRTSSFLNMAVRRGFEPRIRCRIHTFQACSFSHSDTSPYCIAA